MTYGAWLLLDGISCEDPIVEEAVMPPPPILMLVLSSVWLIECMLLTRALAENTPCLEVLGVSGLGWLWQLRWEQAGLGHTCACDGKPWEAVGPTLVQPIVPPFLPCVDPTCWGLFLHKSQAAQAHVIPFCH